MPRPTDKQGLLDLAGTNLDKLLGFIEKLPADVRIKSYENNELNDRDKTVADVICHLHEWHLMVEAWYTLGMAGQKPVIPGEGVTWATLPILNRRIYEKYKDTPLSRAIELLAESHGTVLALIEKHSDEELFTKKRYAWTGTTSLGAYFVSATSSHYDWALKTIKAIKPGKAK